MMERKVRLVLTGAREQFRLVIDMNIGRQARLKGNNFENQVARTISIILFPAKRDEYESCPVDALPIRRRFTTTLPMNGDWKRQGDLLALHDVDLPWCVEAKRHKWYKGSTTVLGLRAPFVRAWEQAVEQARKVKKIPMLFLGGAKLPTLVVTSSKMPGGFPDPELFGAKAIMLKGKPVVFDANRWVKARIEFDVDD